MTSNIGTKEDTDEQSKKPLRSQVTELYIFHLDKVVLAQSGQYVTTIVQRIFMVACCITKWKVCCTYKEAWVYYIQQNSNPALSTVWNYKQLEWMWRQMKKRKKPSRSQVAESSHLTKKFMDVYIIVQSALMTICSYDT